MTPELERFLFDSTSAEVGAAVYELVVYLERRIRERKGTAYGMDREGMQAAALVVNAQAKGMEDALDELHRLMRRHTSHVTASEARTGDESPAQVSGSISPRRAA